MEEKVSTVAQLRLAIADMPGDTPIVLFESKSRPIKFEMGIKVDNEFTLDFNHVRWAPMRLRTGKFEPALYISAPSGN